MAFLFDSVSVFIVSINYFPGLSMEEETILPQFIPGSSIFRPGTFAIPELAITEQRMKTGAIEMTVVGLSLLITIYRALRTVHVQNDRMPEI